MDLIRRLEPLWLLLVVLGALNYAIIGLFDENVISNVFGTGTLTDVIYVVIGFAGLTMVPTLLDRMEHFGDVTRPHHA
jgi:uncharacterized membrane protein YuzA (DUF378 family)